MGRGAAHRRATRRGAGIAGGSSGTDDSYERERRLLDLARVHVDLGDAAVATGLIEQLLELDGDSSSADELGFRLGRQYLQNGQCNRATQAWAAHTNRVPKSKYAPDVQWWSGWCAWWRGEPAAAREHWTRVEAVPLYRTGERRTARPRRNGSRRSRRRGPRRHRARAAAGAHAVHPRSAYAWYAAERLQVRFPGTFEGALAEPPADDPALAPALALLDVGLDAHARGLLDAIADDPQPRPYQGDHAAPGAGAHGQLEAARKLTSCVNSPGAYAAAICWPRMTEGPTAAVLAGPSTPDFVLEGVAWQQSSFFGERWPSYPRLGLMRVKPRPKPGPCTPRYSATAPSTASCYWSRPTTSACGSRQAGQGHPARRGHARRPGPARGTGHLHRRHRCQRRREPSAQARVRRVLRAPHQARDVRGGADGPRRNRRLPAGVRRPGREAAQAQALADSDRADRTGGG